MEEKDETRSAAGGVISCVAFGVVVAGAVAIGGLSWTLNLAGAPQSTHHTQPAPVSLAASTPDAQSSSSCWLFCDEPSTPATGSVPCEVLCDNTPAAVPAAPVRPAGTGSTGSNGCVMLCDHPALPAEPAAPLQAPRTDGCTLFCAIEDAPRGSGVGL